MNHEAFKRLEVVLHEQIRQRVNSILTNEPVLTIIDPHFSIELYTTVSVDGYDAV